MRLIQAGRDFLTRLQGNNLTINLDSYLPLLLSCRLGAKIVYRHRLAVAGGGLCPILGGKDGVGHCNNLEMCCTNLTNLTHGDGLAEALLRRDPPEHGTLALPAFSKRSPPSYRFSWLRMKCPMAVGVGCPPRPPSSVMISRSALRASMLDAGSPSSGSTRAMAIASPTLTGLEPNRSCQHVRRGTMGPRRAPGRAPPALRSRWWARGIAAAARPSTASCRACPIALC